MKHILLFAVITALLTTCNNLEDAKPADRNTFVKSLEGPYDLVAASLEETPNGFVVLANERVIRTDTSFDQTVLIELTENGLLLDNFHAFPGGTGKSFKPIFEDGDVKGYIVVGDSIYIDPQAEQAANVSIASMRILVINSDFTRSKTLYISDKQPISPAHPVKVDFFGGAVNTNEDNEIILLGTYKDGLINQSAAPEKQLLFSLTASRDSAWFKQYDLISNTFANAKSVHYSKNNFDHSKNNIVWATAVADVQGDFISSYVAIPFVKESSEFDNANSYGQNSVQLFLPKDIQKEKNEGLGFGVIGTYSETTDGSKSNMFFVRVDINGFIIPESERYFDAIESFKKDSADVDKNVSSIIDEGESLTATKGGGFVLAGSFTTTPQKGKGGKDIFLVKIDGMGNMLWAKTFGGSGDEIVSAVRETKDGGLIICGTNTLGNYASIFLIKTDKNGDLKN